MFSLKMKSKHTSPHTHTHTHTHTGEESNDIKCTISAKTVNVPSAKLLNFFSTALKPSQMFTRNCAGTFSPLFLSCGYCEMHNNTIHYGGHSTGWDIKSKPKADPTSNRCSHRSNCMFAQLKYFQMTLQQRLNNSYGSEWSSNCDPQNPVCP